MDPSIYFVESLRSVRSRGIWHFLIVNFEKEAIKGSQNAKNAVSNEKL